MADRIFLPEGNGGNNGVDAGSLALASLLGNGNNGFLGGSGWGGGILGFLIGLMFGNGGFGNGLFGGNNGNSGRDMLMQAITSSGESSRAAVQSLSTMIGQDFNLVNSAVQSLSAAVNQIANAQGVNALQVVNAVQSGNAALASQLAQCCCNNQLALANQTNALQNGINGVNQAIAAKSAADQMATCQQTYALTENANRNFLALDNKIDALESSRKDRELAAANAKIATLESQQFTAAALQQALNPVLGQLAALNADVQAIKRCQPQTITLPNNSMTAVPTIWANAFADNFVDRVNAALAAAGTTTPTTPATNA